MKTTREKIVNSIKCCNRALNENNEEACEECVFLPIKEQRGRDQCILSLTGVVLELLKEEADE